MFYETYDEMRTNDLLTTSTTCGINMYTWCTVTKIEKAFQRIKKNPRNVPRHELISLLEAHGFEAKGGKGSHSCFRHPDLPGEMITIPDRNPVSKVYVVRAINSIQMSRGLE